MESLARLAVTVVAASLLAGCGASPTPIVTPGAVSQSHLLPETASGDLLYATTTDDKYVYMMTYPKISVLHQLGPFSGMGPQGLCADGGYLYVVVPATPSQHGGEGPGHVYIFKHGATSATRALKVPAGGRSCTVDPASGNLAVLGSGDLDIYRHSSGSPKVYNLSYYTPCDAAYGDAGKLYVAAGCFTLAEFVHGGLRYFTLNARITGPIHIQWNDGLVVATTYARGWPSDYHQDVYLIKPGGSHRAQVQLVELDRKKREEPSKTTESWVQDRAIFAPDHLTGALNFWAYPQGGEPDRYVHVSSIDARFTHLVISPGS